MTADCSTIINYSSSKNNNVLSTSGPFYATCHRLTRVYGLNEFYLRHLQPLYFSLKSFHTDTLCKNSQIWSMEDKRSFCVSREAKAFGENTYVHSFDNEGMISQGLTHKFDTLNS